MHRLLFFITLLMFLHFNGHSADLEFWLEMARTHNEQQEYDLEQASLKKVKAMDPNHPYATKRLQELETKLKLGKIKRSKRDTALSALLDEDNDVRIVSKKRSKIFKDPHEEAKFLIKMFREDKLSNQQKKEIEKKLGEYFFYQGIEATKREKVKVAIEMLEKSIFYNNEYQLAYYELGYLYFKIRELQAGIQNLEKFVKLQPYGILTKTVKGTLLDKYMSIARKKYYKKDFKGCLPYLEKIIRLNKRSPDSKQALFYLMNLYYYRGMDFLKVDDYKGAGSNFYEALLAVREKPNLDPSLFKKLAKNAVDPFIKLAQNLFIKDKNYGQSFKYFEAVTWLIPGSAHSFLAKEYLKEIKRLNGTAENPIVYFSNFIEEENQRFLIEEKRFTQKE
jgi:tetratricopeptide (TPR) repeat protein